MKRLSLCLAIVSAFAVAAPAGVGRAGCLPSPTGDVGDPNILCSYLALPQTACRTVETSLLTNPTVPVPAKDLLRTAAVCAKVPNGARAGGMDANIFNLGSSTIVPNDSVDVGITRSIYVHNLDSQIHSFTEEGCLDTVAATPCRFNKILQVGAWGLFANTVVVSSGAFDVEDVVRFRCRFQAGYSGTFEVTA